MTDSFFIIFWLPSPLNKALVGSVPYTNFASELILALEINSAIRHCPISTNAFSTIEQGSHVGSRKKKHHLSSSRSLSPPLFHPELIRPNPSEFFSRISPITPLPNLYIFGPRRHRSCRGCREGGREVGRRGSLFPFRFSSAIGGGMCHDEFLLSPVDSSVRSPRKQTNKQDPISRWIETDAGQTEKNLSALIFHVRPRARFPCLLPLFLLLIEERSVFIAAGWNF